MANRVGSTLRVGGRSVQDVINLACAVLLFVSPWALDYLSDMAAAKTAWISAIVVAVIAIAALVSFAQWMEWLTLLVGAWLIAAPLVMGFTGVVDAVAAHMILGIVVVAASISELWMVRDPAATAQN